VTVTSCASSLLLKRKRKRKEKSRKIDKRKRKMLMSKVFYNTVLVNVRDSSYWKTKA